MGTVAFRGGLSVPRAGSDLFTFTEKQFKIDKKDFNAPAFSADADFFLTDRVSIVGGVEYAATNKASEYRDFVDNQRLPIEQTTFLSNTNVDAGVKFDLVPHGREISQHAWIPSAVTPYVGAGAGAMHYKFMQSGDFINTSTLAVFHDNLLTGGWAPSAHVFGGVDVKLAKRVYGNAELRYLWSHADVGQDYSGFAPIDLAGMKTTAGVRFLF